jgi:hypothetical protein
MPPLEPLSPDTLASWADSSLDAEERLAVYLRV